MRRSSPGPTTASVPLPAAPASPSGSSCSVSVAFTPIAIGDRPGVLTLVRHGRRRCLREGCARWNRPLSSPPCLRAPPHSVSSSYAEKHHVSAAVAHTLQFRRHSRDPGGAVCSPASIASAPIAAGLRSMAALRARSASSSRRPAAAVCPARSPSPGRLRWGGANLSATATLSGTGLALALNPTAIAFTHRH